MVRPRHLLAPLIILKYLRYHYLFLPPPLLCLHQFPLPDTPVLGLSLPLGLLPLVLAFLLLPQLDDLPLLLAQPPQTHLLETLETRHLRFLCRQLPLHVRERHVEVCQQLRLEMLLILFELSPVLLMRFLLPLLRHLFSLRSDRTLKLPLVLSLYLLCALLYLHLHPPFDDLHLPLVLPDDLLYYAFLDGPTQALLQLPGQLLAQLRLNPPGELVAEALVQVRLPLATQVLQAVRPDEGSLMGKFVLVRGF